MKNLLIVFVALISLSVQAQYTPLSEVQMGPEFKGKGKWNKIIFNVIDSNDNIYSVSKRSGRGSRMVIDVFDKEMKHKTQYYIKGERDERFVMGKFFNGQLKFVAINSGDGKAILYDVDLKNEEFIEDRIIFDYSDQKIERGGGGSLFSGRHSTSDYDTGGHFLRSRSDQYFMYSTDLKNGRKGDEKHQIAVLDNEFNLIYESTFERQIKDDLFIIKSFDLNDVDGSVLFTAKVYENDKRKESKRRSRKDKEANYHLEIGLINAEGANMYSFGEEKFFIKDVASNVKDGKLVIAGYYSDERVDRASGIYLGTFDSKTLQNLGSSLTPFSDEFVSEINDSASKRKTKRKKKREESFLVVQEVLISDEGSIFVVGEEDYFVTNTSFSNGTYTTYNIYHNDKIAVSRFSVDGTHFATDLIRKQQVTQGALSDIYSYYAFVNGNQLNLFINVKELDEDESAISLTFKDGREKKLSLFHIQLNADSGQIEYKKVLANDKNGSYAMSIRNAKKLNTNSFIIDGNDGRTKRFVKISL